MTLRRQLLLLALVHVLLALAAWDGYRIGYRKGRAVRLTPQISIEIEPDPPTVTLPEPPAEPTERGDANWRRN